MSETLRIGSRVRLKHASYGYLDTCEWVRNEPQFAPQNGSTLVQTSTAADRDRGSGTWEIVSAKGAPAGTPVDRTMQLHLRNAYPNAGYLALRGKAGDSDAKTLDAIDPTQWGNAMRYVQTVATLDGTNADVVGPASFALELVPAPGDHSPSPVVDGALVQLRCYDDNTNFYLGSYGPLSDFSTLTKTYPASQTGLVFASPTVSTTGLSSWTVSVVGL